MTDTNRVYISFLLITSVLTIGSIAVYCFLVANRGLHIGSDTYQYFSIFYSYKYDPSIKFGYEIGFHYLNRILSSFITYKLYLFIVSSIICTNLLYCCFIINKHLKDSIYLRPLMLIATFGCLYYSNWFFSANVNGIRQGISLSFLYIGMLHIGLNRNLKISTIYFILALSFHSSSALAILFTPLLYIRNINTIFWIVILSSISYYLNFTEILIKSVSDILNVPIYYDIKNYAELDSSINWYGFNIYFVLYTLSWFLILYISIYKNLIFNTSLAKQIFKIYSALTLVLLIFGFGGFSNRYGFMSWLFAPFLQAFLIINLKTSITIRFYLSGLIFIIGFLYTLNWFT